MILVAIGGTVFFLLAIAYGLYKMRPRCDQCGHNVIFQGVCAACKKPQTIYGMKCDRKVRN
jgi:hypothetical protein